MAQISYIKYTDVLEARRYDAEYFKPEYLEIEKKLGNMKYSLLNSFCNFCKKGIFDISPKYYKNKGIPLIRTSEIKNPFIDFSTTVFLDENIHTIYKNTELETGDLIFTKIGAYIGDVSILPPEFEKYNFSQNVAGLSIKKDKISPYFLLSFLLSKYSRNQILRIAMLSGQGKLELKDIKNIKIPILSQPFQLQIEQIVKSAHQKQSDSKQLYHEAEQLLLAELGLLDYEVKHSLWFTTTKNEVSVAHRYDSEYFQPKYAKIIKKIESYEGGWDLVKNAVNFKDKNYTPKEDQKYKYLALSNISSQGYIQDYQEEFGKDLPSRARRIINANDLIISSIEGSLSSCALVEKEFDNSICSTGFFVLNSAKINSETLLILFKSLVIQELLQRGSKGTILTAISKTELESIKIPLIKPSIQKQIAEKIAQSHKLRKESKELLEEAKRKVEEEIEK